VNYEEKRNHLLALIESTLIGEIDQRQLLTEVITDKIMAEDFNQSFYKGIGQTSSHQLPKIIEFGAISLTKAILRNGTAIAFAVLNIILVPSKPEKLSSIGWTYAVPSQYFSTLVNLEKLRDFFDQKISSQGFQPPLQYLIQSSSVANFKSADRIKVVPHIGLAILKSGKRSKSRLLLVTLARTSKWISMSFRNPILWRVGLEYVVDLQAIDIRRSAKDLLVTTQSHLLNPPIAFKANVEWQKVMFWYSDNGRQILGKESMAADYSYLARAEIGLHFVWTNSWASILAAQNKNAKVLAIGPIIFSNLVVRESNLSQNLKRAGTILIFDVTPKKIADDQSIYSEEIMQNFIKDIIEACEESQVGLNLHLKPKRKYSRGDSKSYVNYLSETGNKITTLKWDCDSQSTIESSELVICIPFTSPALISQFLGVPCIFYSPLNGFVFERDYEGIPVIQGKHDLVAWFSQNYHEQTFRNL